MLYIYVFEQSIYISKENNRIKFDKSGNNITISNNERCFKNKANA